jgi:hypothetical protein
MVPEAMGCSLAALVRRNAKVMTLWVSSMMGAGSGYSWLTGLPGPWVVADQLTFMLADVGIRLAVNGVGGIGDLYPLGLQVYTSASP